MANIKEANAEYTGGNIWLFYGKTDDGNYFLTDDYGSTQILDAYPGDNWEDCTYYEWQLEHLVKELDGDELREFQKQIIEYLKMHSEHRNGISIIEIDAYEKYWKEGE